MLEFEDRDAADAFVQNDNLSEQLTYRRLGIWVRPVKFCECPTKQRQQLKNWRKGKRTGLQLCVVCKRPSPAWERGLLQRIGFVLGHNQLEIEDTD